MDLSRLTSSSQQGLKLSFRDVISDTLAASFVNVGRRRRSMAPRLCLFLFSDLTTEAVSTKAILPRFNTVFAPAAEIASYIIHQPLVIYSLQLLASFEMHTFYAVLRLQFLFLRCCSVTPACLNFTFFFTPPVTHWFIFFNVDIRLSVWWMMLVRKKINML